VTVAVLRVRWQDPDAVVEDDELVSELGADLCAGTSVDGSVVPLGEVIVDDDVGPARELRGPARTGERYVGRAAGLLARA
jgi:hypothetical protein